MSDGFKYTGPGYYRTHDGRKASVAEHEGALYGVVFSPECAWYSTRWQMNGKFAEDPSPFDLVGPWTEPRKISGWVNVYPGGVSGGFSQTRAGADRFAHGQRIACIYVTGTEGVEPEGDCA